MHPDLALGVIDRLCHRHAEIAQHLEILVAHGLDFERMRLRAFRQSLDHAVQAQGKVSANRRVSELLASAGVAIPYRATRRTKVLDHAQFFAFARLEQPQDSALVLLCISPPELIPECAGATIPDLGTAQVRPVCGAAVVFVPLIDRLDDWRCHVEFHNPHIPSHSLRNILSWPRSSAVEKST